MGYKEVEIKAKCVKDYSDGHIEFQKDKLYTLVKSDEFGARVYVNKHDYVTFPYCDYTFYFMDVSIYRSIILEELLSS